MKAKTKLTKLWSILLALVMVVGMLPTVALAEGSATADFTSGDGSAALALLNAAKTGTTDSTWDSSNNTLTLNGVNFTTTAAIAVILPDDAKIVLADNTVNTIKGGDSDSLTCYGIYAEGSLTIKGTGKLDVTGGTATDEDGDDSYGIYTEGSLTISEDADVTANGGTATDASCGIEAEGDVTIIGGTVKVTGGASNDYNSYGIYGENVIISGGTVTATGGAASGYSLGIYAYGDKDDIGVKISGGATVTAAGGSATNYDSNGICAKYNVSITGGTVKATAGTAKSLSVGISADSGAVSISGGTVEATGGTATDDSYGIYSGYSGTSTNAISISGTANVTAKGGEATKDSYGIYSKRNTEISGGTVKAYGGDTSSGYSYGIYTDGSLTISDDADVTANGGKANYNSYGIYANTGLTISGDNTVVTATGGEERARKSKGIFVNSNYVTIESGKVEATGGKAGVESYGIEARDNIEISGGTVTATGGEVTSGAFTYSYGIYSNNNVTISNTATVTAKGGETTNYDSTCSHGIYASNGLSISGGTVTAQAGTAKTARAFEKSPSISISPNYWWRTSESGTYTASSNNGYAWDSAHTYVEIRDTAPAATTTYTVTFDANGGSGTMADVPGLLGDYTLPANGFTAPAGKRFKCWSVNGAEKAVGATINVTANTTVTAVWETIVTAVWETIPATSTEYDILDGANSSWTQNSDGSLSIRGSGAFSEFVGVKVDGKSVDEQYYTVKEGPTIVTLKAEYLSTLAAGPHTIQLIWKDGTASTTFNINVNNPNTGDNGGLALAAALLALSAAAIAASGFNRKRGKSSR